MDKKYNISSKSSIGKTYRQLLFKILTNCNFNNVLEIGCLRGYSSCAFIEALNCGCDFCYTICDPMPRMDMKLLDMCKKRSNITFLQKPSLEVIKPGFDFIFVDGDHSVKYIPQELRLLIDSGAETVLAHDTYIQNPKYQGPPLYRYCFSRHKDFYYIEDNTFRPSEERELCGLSFFTKKTDVFNKVQPLFKEIGNK
jgi:predicted O-methyltransferase YrrM